MKTLINSNKENTMENNKRFQWYQLNFERPFTAAQVQKLLENLATDPTTGAIAFEARVRGGKVNYFVRLQSNEAKQFMRYFEACMPTNSGLTELAKGKRRETQRALQLKCTKSTLSLTPEKIETISLAILTAMREAENEDEEVVIQISIGERYLPMAVPKHLNDPSRNTLMDKILGTTRPMSSEDIISLKARYAKYGFCCDVRVGASCTERTDDEAAERTLEIILATMGGVHTASIIGSKIDYVDINDDDITFATRPKKHSMQLCPNEVAGLLAWPYGNMMSPALQPMHPKVLAPPRNLPDSHRTFARAAAEGYEHIPLGIPIEDSMKHTYIIGPTGVGKSNVIERLALDDIYADRGVVLIEPKTDSGKAIMTRIPKERWGDVVYIDPLSTHPIGINPFSAIKHGADPYVVAEGIYTVFKNLSKDSWGKRMGDILMSALLTLAKVPDANILMLLPLLTDATYRRPIIEKISDEDRIGLGQFWDWFDGLKDREQQEAIAPIMRRLREFTLKPALCAMLGQSHPKVDLNDVFTAERKIFIISLNKGKIGEETAKLLGSLIVSQLWSLTLARGNTPIEERYPASIFIDEVQSYLNLPLDLAEALSQARSYGVGFTLAHQYRNQLPSQLRSAIDGNVQNIIAFGLYDSNDCMAMSKLAGDLLTADDFLFRKAYHIYLRTQMDGKPVWISGVTLPPIDPTTYWTRIKEMSEELYGVAREEVVKENLAKGNIEEMVTTTLSDADFGATEIDEADDKSEVENA